MDQRYFSLAPTNLPNKRLQRYDGKGFSVSIDDFTPQDRATVTTIYQNIKAVYDLWLYMKEAPNYAILEESVQWLMSDAFVTIGKDLGTEADYNSQDIKKVIHDVRGGALMSMVSYATRIATLNLYHKVDVMRSFVFLARDQAKMMRNAIYDIDVPTRTADERLRIHSIYDYIKKWGDFEYHHNQRIIKVNVQCLFEGNVTTCCLEASALDRVLYNLMNNALRFADGEMITLTIFPVGDILRWVIENTVRPEAVEWLQTTVGEDMSSLFRGGITDGGNGIGLSNCAEIVGASFGISAVEAITSGYITAKLIDRTFYACFHWNIVRPDDH
ncbi:MAG: ATP-binding protein [Candidatus Kapabacteria bacterium]|nr:ATP-binding protein [Candidatus Kapabacteria bacterium]